MLRSSLVFSLLAVLAFAATSQAVDFRATHGVDGAAFEKWFADSTAAGYRTVYAAGIQSQNRSLFAAVAIKDGKNLAFQVRRGLTPAKLQETFEQLTAQGYRQTSISGYREGNDLRYIGIWTKDGTTNAWESRVELTSAKYQEAFNRTTGQGMMPAFMSGYSDGAGGGRMAAIFRKQPGVEWNARHDLTAADYQKAVTENAAKQFRPATLAIYPSAKGPLFGVVFVKDTNPWTARHNLTTEGYQQEFNAQAKAGLRPESIVPYIQDGSLRYAAIWIKDGPAAAAAGPVVAPPLPASGTQVGELAAVENALLQFMRDRGIPAGTLAIGHNRQLVYARGFGYADKGRTRVIQPSDPFRLASVVKPFTAAAIRKLIAEGELSPNDKAFSLVNVAGPASLAKNRDARIDDITIDNLLTHRGGWSREKSFDPMFRTWEISETLGYRPPPGAKDVIAYMLSKPLQFAPGSEVSYSNFGYAVLGRVIETKTGKSYIDYLRQDLLAPLKVRSIEVGSSLVAGRNPREPWYSDPNQDNNVFAAKRGTLVPSPDGSFHLEAMDAHGGLIGSAPDLIRFLDAYWISGHPRQGKVGQEWTHFGSLPGTFTMARQRKDGVNIAVLFNQRADPSGKSYDEIQQVLDKAIDSIRNWPDESR